MAGRHAHRCHIDDLLAVAPGRVAFGPAATIRFLPRREDLRDPARHDFAPLFRAAIGDAPAGRVLVMSAGGHPEESLAGGKKLSRVRNHGLAGVVCDGRLRDVAGLAAMGVAAWCAGETIRWAGDHLMPFAASVPVALRGVTVVPGDWVYADDAGVAVIPAGDVEAVLHAAAGIERRDAEAIDRIAREDAAAG